VFGAPRHLADHADRALAAAAAIAGSGGDGVAMEVGIGLNSGTVVAGNIGGAGRLEFSVIGDVVNTAARVEEATRVTGDVVLLSEATRELLTRPWPGLAERHEMSLKGKARPVRLYAYLSEPRSASLTGSAP
jgi:adenylate cyclase